MENSIKEILDKDISNEEKTIELNKLLNDYSANNCFNFDRFKYVNFWDKLTTTSYVNIKTKEIFNFNILYGNYIELKNLKKNKYESCGENNK